MRPKNHKEKVPGNQFSNPKTNEILRLSLSAFLKNNFNADVPALEGHPPEPVYSDKMFSDFARTESVFGIDGNFVVRKRPYQLQFEYPNKHHAYAVFGEKVVETKPSARHNSTTPEARALKVAT